ncbi:hypothetical protein AVEN_275147-1 [Araneus ventricosus]|uniref:Uncharacterized protein n=1 Tax=Araneus ventricosus TaxID=182803 RepID=A0A4Y2LIF4_ARAVE|nr:hypothetical protein AVEN_275147-1 [Araneus ventricosus]
MTPRVFPFVPQARYFTRLITSVRCCPNHSINCCIYLLLTMPTPYEEMKCLRKLLAEVETDEMPDFDSEDNGPEDVIEVNFT